MSSQKEKDIIEQQRRLAMMMGKKPKPPLPTKTKPTSNLKTAGLTLKAANPSKRPQLPTTSLSKKPPPPPSYQIPLKTANGSSVAPPSGEQKRPTRPGMKRPSSNSLSSSAATVLAAARAKLSIDSKTIDLTPDGDGLPQLKRKTKVASKSNTLAKLVQNVAAKPLEDGDSLSSAAFSSNISPEDFWKNLRDWDFVSDLANQQQWQSSSNASAEESSLIPKKKPLPDTFVSHRHYVAAWAPLCLAESRAQLLSDVLTETAQNSNRRPPLLIVNVETTWKGGSRKKDQGLHTDLMTIDSCNVLIKTKHRGDGGSLQFFTHDVCCLIPVAHKDIVERLLRGGEVKTDTIGDSFRKYAIVGHTEVSRKEVNGLIIKVSKRKWAQVGNAEMYLLKIGGNITSLREFTALCAVETIPLKRYLLGQHLEEKDIRLANARRAPRPESQKQELLKKMGGVEALGKGFTEYAQKKFNPSQLTAISASAQGYGDGGFTLIKGPPGTGSKLVGCLDPQ
jgi:senataxin